VTTLQGKHEKEEEAQYANVGSAMKANSVSTDSKCVQIEKQKDTECVRCKVDLTNFSKWYRCTCCPNFNMCEQCNTSDFHKAHMVYTQDFTPPANPTLPYCDACGKTFCVRQLNNIVYKCTIPDCNDYAICGNCNYWGMHWHHAKCLIEVPMSEYLNT
jgi:hypothetical protein